MPSDAGPWMNLLRQGGEWAVWDYDMTAAEARELAKADSDAGGKTVSVSHADAARAGEMREALEFYARESNWYKDQSAPNTQFFMRGEGGPSFAEKDRGERARKALGQEGRRGGE